MSALFDEENNIVSGTLNIGSGEIYDIVLSDTSGLATVFNQNNLDIDFAVSGEAIGDGFYYDASAGRLGINITSPDSVLHMVTDCANDGLKVENITDCPTGVNILFVHNPQTAPDSGSYPVTINLAGRDDNYSTINYAQIKARILDPTTENTSGEIIFTVDHTGVNETIFRSSLINTVLGGLNTAEGDFYDILGYNNTSSGVSYIILGNNNDSTQNTGILIGNSNVVSGDNSIAIVNTSDINGDHNIAFGISSVVDGQSNVVFGSNVNTTGENNILIGQSNNVSGTEVVGLLSDANIVGNSGIGFGVSADVNGDLNIHIGSNVSISGDNDIVIGSNANVSGERNLVHGNETNTDGNDIISIGQQNTAQNINSGIYIGNNISLSDSNRSVIIGLGTTTTSGLDDSILLGVNNSTLTSAPSRLVLIGQNNTVSEITESLVVGNDNDLEGTVANNIIVGPRNNVPLESNNNLVVGLLNNTSGIVISTDGSIVGTDTKTEGDAMANTNVFGINNWVTEASGSLIFGNKSRVHGLNVNNLGSYCNFYGNDLQSLGNSNFILGNNNAALGSYNDILGSRSISFNVSNTRNQIFGDSNVIIGNNEVIVSGMVLGFNNEIYGPNNVVVGKNNFVGNVRYPCRVSGTNIVMLGDISAFEGGDVVMVALHSPATQDDPVFVRTILDGVDEATNLPLGILKDNTINNSTTLVVDSTIDVNNTVEYYVKTTFDDIVHGQDPCDACFADVFAGYVSGYVMHFQDGNDSTDLIANPRYGNYNLVLGNNNIQKHSSGLILGHNNHASGVNHIIIGHGLSGYYNNTIQIGTNNDNKLVLDNTKIIFNTGEFQRNLYVNSSAPEDGANDARVMSVDLYENRVGLNVTDPRSTLDVSGVLTTENLRVGLGTIPGYTLHADADGNASWELPVNLSGQNSGLVFMVNENVGSGIRELIFNTGTREFSYLRADKDFSDDFNLDPGEVEERILIIGQSGLYLNLGGSDYGYDFIVRGTGIQNPVNGDDSIYLIKTINERNAIRVHNITGVSGHLHNLTVNDGIIAPVNLTGTILRVNSLGSLTSQSFDKHSVLFTDLNYQSSGNNSFRYYNSAQALTIGLTGEPPSQANNGLVTGPSNDFNNIILSSAEGVDTVFNNAGKNNKFIVVESANGGTKKGLQYDTDTGNLGISVSSGDDDWQVSSTSDRKRWYEAGRLVVDGKIRARSLQLTSQGKVLEGSNSVNKYLKVVDAAGNIGLDTLDLSYQFAGVHPLFVEPNEANQIVTVSLSTLNRNGGGLGDADNGRMILWDGSNWIHSRGIRFVQPALGGSTDGTAGIEFGPESELNSCRNNHAYAGGSFCSPGLGASPAWDGSSQISRYYLRGRTLSDSDPEGTMELIANYHKDLNTKTATTNNTISIQYNLGDDTDDHERSLAWSFTVKYTALFNDGTTTGYGQVAGEIKGSLFSYIDAANERQTSINSVVEIYKQYSGGVSYAVDDPITITIKDNGDAASVQRLAITANGTNSWNGLWSAVVEVHQVHVPRGINFSNSDVA